MTDRASGVGGWTDPHNGGTYSFSSTSESSIEGKRTTGDGKYTDKYDFSFETNASGGCDVSACSESQVMSVLDYSTNYCNLHSLYCNSADGCPTTGTDLTYCETFNSCKQHDASACTPNSASSFLSDVVAPATAAATGALRGSVKGDECKTVTTAPNFDLEAYITGRWYIQQQAETAYLPKEQNWCVYAEYERMDKKSFWGYEVQVHNYAQEEDGTPHDSGDKICAASAGQPTIDTGDGCKSGSGTNNSGLWVFTRGQERDDALVEKVRGLAKDQGFDLSVLRDVDQSAC